MKPDKNILKTAFYFKYSLKFKVKIKKKFMEENLQNQKVSSVQTLDVTGKTRNLAMVFLLVLVGVILLGGTFYAGIKFSENRQNRLAQDKTGSQSTPSITPNQGITAVSGNKELSEWYSVEYPSNFFVTRRDYRTFGVAENRWKGETGHIPEATIQMYTNVLPDGMNLKDWVNGVGDPTPPVGQGTPKSCKEFLNSLRQKVKFGDLFNVEYLTGDNCIYFGVFNIKETTIAGLPAIEFGTQNVSSGATHTIVAYKNQSGVILLFDIYYTITGMSDEKDDQTIDAYKSFLRTLKIRLE